MTNFLFPLPSNVFQPQTPEAWNTAELNNADTLGLKTTSWEQGDPTRTIFAIVANLLGLVDVNVSLLAQGGFLDYAADGSVTYIDPVSGQTITALVTPDPSDPAQNPTGALGLLDVLAFNVYDELRTLAAPAGGTLAIANVSASTYGPFDEDGYHVAQPSAVGSPSYHNTDTISIPPSTVAGAGVTGATGTPIAVTDVGHGLTTDDFVFIDGVLGNLATNGFFQITVTDADHFTLNGSTSSGSYTGGGTVYIPQTESFTADESGTASNAASAGVVNHPVTSLIGVSVWNTGPWIGANTQTNDDLASTCRLHLQSLSPNGPKGAYEYFAKKAQILAPTLTPPLSVSAPITKVLVQTDLFTGTVTTTIANAAGAPSVFDVLAVDAVLQAYCVPDAVTAITQAADNASMAVVINVWVPAAYATQALTVATAAVENWFQSPANPIGGVTNPTETPPNENVVAYNAVLGAVFDAMAVNKIPVQQVTGTVDGGTSNVQLLLTPTPQIAILSGTPTVTVIPV